MCFGNLETDNGIYSCEPGEAAPRREPHTPPQLLPGAALLPHRTARAGSCPSSPSSASLGQLRITPSVGGQQKPPTRRETGPTTPDQELRSNVTWIRPAWLRWVENTCNGAPQNISVSNRSVRRLSSSLNSGETTPPAVLVQLSGNSTSRMWSYWSEYRGGHCRKIMQGLRQLCS